MVYTVRNDTYPGEYATTGRNLYFIPYQYGSLIGPEKWWHINDQEYLYHIIDDYWSRTIWIALVYSVGIHALQKVMSNREPCVLKRPLILWNTTLALFSLIGLVRMGEEFLFVLRTRPLIDSISYSPDPLQPGGFWAVCFALSKILELGDTVFIVLRKKPLIFLHWYHHAVVLVLVAHSCREGVAGGRWFVCMNYGVHTLMYTYYALAAAGVRLHRKFSMLLTTLQTTQMFIGVAISFIVFYFKMQGKIMQHSYENLYFCFAIYASFAILFSDFFNKSYIEKEEKRKTQ